MSASAVVFYILSVVVLGAALVAVTSRKIFRSAIWLLFSLTGIAGLYFWLQMEFVAAVQIVVYVGGIVVLIIFSIFLTQQSGKDLPPPVRVRAVFSALAAGAGFVLTCLMLSRYAFPAAVENRGEAVAGVGTIGAQLLSTSDHGYVLPFEVISVLLLAAMIGCIVIAMKTKPDNQ
jgi:NADH-quinone oxidoreductase subunit J